MDWSATSKIERSPLDQIRRAEAEVTRQVAAALRASEATAQQAQAQAEDIKRHALRTGKNEGQAQHREIISRADEEARGLVAQAQRRAEIVRRQGDLRLDDLALRAVEIVIGQEQEITNT
jgi:flagellar biosynthesis/type III secretory pathway protein FliH